MHANLQKPDLQQEWFKTEWFECNQIMIYASIRSLNCLFLCLHLCSYENEDNMHVAAVVLKKCSCVQMRFCASSICKIFLWFVSASTISSNLKGHIADTSHRNGWWIYRALQSTCSNRVSNRVRLSDCQSLSPAPCEVEQSTSQTIALWRVPRCGGRGCERNPSPFAKCTHLCCAAGNAGNQYEGYERLKKDCNCLEKNLKYRYTWYGWVMLSHYWNFWNMDVFAANKG